MKLKQTLTTTACLATLCGALHGQTSEKMATFQYFAVNDVPGNIAVSVNAMPAFGKHVIGRPISATEERRTVQVLGDGTRIDKKDTDVFFRDSEGRTRTERDNGATILISDPVSGFSASLNTANKTARKSIVAFRTGVAGPAGSATVLGQLKLEAEARATKAATPSTITVSTTTSSSSFSSSDTVTINKTETTSTGKAAQPGASEDLGTQIVNGVPAKGTRTTITIPAGQIGNDREIKVVSERWFSEDLQMLVKSSNNDPRFGETTYQLTGIVQASPDPSLFQIPSDFSVSGQR